MRAGQMDQRVTIEALQDGKDDYGQPINDWATYITCWAAVEPLQGREYLAAMQLQSETTIRVRLRYRPGVTSSMRVNHGGKLYGITSVIHVRSGARELQLMCRKSG